MPALRCGSRRASIRFCACIGTMNRFVLVLVVVLVLENMDAVWDFEDEDENEDEWVGSWKASIRFCACIGTMNPPLAPPRRGTDRTRTDAFSPPGRGWGWVGSWRDRAPSAPRRGAILSLSLARPRPFEETSITGEGGCFASRHF